MNIEKSTEILKEFRNYNKFHKEENKDLTITITLEAKESIDKAIERLLTAYEKEKEKNKELTDEYLVQRDLINPDFFFFFIHKEKIKKYINKIQKELNKYKIKNTNTYIQIEGNPEIDGLLIQKATLEELIKEE